MAPKQTPCRSSQSPCRTAVSRSPAKPGGLLLPLALDGPPSELLLCLLHSELDHLKKWYSGRASHTSLPKHSDVNQCGTSQDLGSRRGIRTHLCPYPQAHLAISGHPRGQQCPPYEPHQLHQQRAASAMAWRWAAGLEQHAPRSGTAPRPALSTKCAPHSRAGQMVPLQASRSPFPHSSERSASDKDCLNNQVPRGFFSPYAHTNT